MSAEEERLRRVSAAVAEQMDVHRYTLMIPAHSGESSAPGAAYADPTDNSIYMTLAAAAPLTDDELTGALAHEFGHLVVPEPLAARLFRFRPLGGIHLARVLACALGATVAMFLAIAGDAMVPGYAVIAAAACGALLGGAAERIITSWRLRRYELRCDIAAAHAIGTSGISLFAHDPARLLPRHEYWLIDHPSTQQRVGAITRHANRASCACPPSGPMSVG